MKIGIVTLYFPEQWDNYGGILQNYALYKTLKEFGCQVHTLGFIYAKFPMVLYKMFVRFLYKHFGLQVKIKKCKISYIGIQRERNKKFHVFIDNNIEMKIKWIIKKQLDINKEYDLFFVGSDQVWNPYWAVNKDTAYTYFLSFADEHKRISYAASFGSKDIPEEAVSLFKNGLEGLNKISVRERDAIDIISKITDVEAEVVLDPTLLLTKNEWLEIQKKPQNIAFTKPYVLTYFLGDNLLQIDEYINKLNLKDDYEFYHLNRKEFENLYVLDPAEFVYMINNASIVLTDSFHACVFSFILDKPFLVFDRISSEGDMSSRISSLLEMLSLERKYVNSGLYNDIWEHDYHEAFKRIEIEKKKSINYIKESIKYGNKT